MTELSFDIASLHDFYAMGGNPEHVIALSHQRLAAAADPGIFIHLLPTSDTRATALALGKFDPVSKPLWGIPFAVKDNIDVAGLPTTAACPDFAFQPSVHAPVVARLLEAGAILIGKTNLDQFATGLVGVRTPYPAPKNPFDPERVPGGSSSGSAVAVARRCVSFSLGTDTAGSGRVPAGLNNLVGLKPSLGALSTRGVLPACKTLDCVSIFALNVADARRVFDLVAHFDAQDPYSRPFVAHDGKVRMLGVPRQQDRLFFGDRAAERAYEKALSDMSRAGLPMREINMSDFFAVAQLLYEGPWVAERRAAIRAFMDKKPEALFPVTRNIISSADLFSATDMFEAFYKLQALRRATEKIWDEIDALVVPTSPIAPKVVDLEADPIGPNSRLGTYTNFVNLLDLCALAVPGPFRSDGMPAGTTLIAPRGHDRILTDLGARIFGGTGGFDAHRGSTAA
jgi:allophanate hydrolase